MAVIEYDSYKQKLLAMSDTFENLQKALDIESSKHEIARLEAEAHEDGFWNDIERSQANQMRTKQLQNKVHRFEKLVSTRDDLLALIDMGNEMDDASLLPELEEGFADLADFFEGLAAIEKSHENRYQLLIERIRKIQAELPPLESDVSEEEAAFTEAAEEQLAQTQAQRRFFYLRR